MVKPVALDFEYKIQTIHNTTNTEPELSFISILKDTVKNNEATNAALIINDNVTVEPDNNVAMLQVRDHNEKLYNTGQEVQKSVQRVIADRPNAQKDAVDVDNPDIIQSLAGSSLHTNKVAIVTDKNTHTTKKNVYKKDASHSLNLRHIYTDTNQNFSANFTVLKKLGKETLHDIINQLQKLNDGKDDTKNLKKSDLKQLLAQLTAFQHMRKKDLHSAVLHTPMIKYNNLSDNKNKKVLRKSVSDAHLMHAGDKAYKSVNNSQTILIDAVKQKSKIEDAPKLNKNVVQATERNESFIQVNTKHHTTNTTTIVSKPLEQNQLMQILNRAKVMQEGQKTSLSLKLYPESLGKLSVTMGLEHGIVSGRFLVESQEAKEQLLLQLESIRWELENNGVQVGEFEVNVKEHRQREFTEMPGLSRKQNGESAEYESISSRYIYHDGLLDVII
ncbi:MAG: flagellar hook-length control protein FliK [Spirochaetota bacterium]